MSSHNKISYLSCSVILKLKNNRKDAVSVLEFQSELGNVTKNKLLLPCFLPNFLLLCEGRLSWGATPCAHLLPSTDFCEVTFQRSLKVLGPRSSD